VNSVGNEIAVSEALSINASSRSNSKSAKSNQAVKENAKSRQLFSLSSEIMHPKNSRHLTNFEDSLKLAFLHLLQETCCFSSRLASSRCIAHVSFSKDALPC